jgi:hypothetical protein
VSTQKPGRRELPVQYTWSRFSASPVEHVTDGTMFAQPLCGTYLSVGYQHIEDQPSGLAPVCTRCTRKLNRQEA